MPVLQWKKIGQPSKTAGMSGRLCQAKIWLGAAMSNASPHLSVLTMKPHCPLGIVIWNQILSLQSLPTEKLFYFLSTEKRFSNFQSNLLVANLPSFCFCTTNHFTSTSIFPLPVVYTHAGITKTSLYFSLRNRQQNFRNCSCAHNARKKIYQTLSLFQSDILLLALPTLLHQII